MEEKVQEIQRILECKDYYKILGVSRDADFNTIRKAYILKSRYCHPDKSPTIKGATEAFQKLSSAYETLSNPIARKKYDGFGVGLFSDDSNVTFARALFQIYKDFLLGDFDNLLAMIDLIHQRNPEFQFDRDSANKLLVELRDIMLLSGKYLEVVKDEILRLYDIQTELSSLSYFNLLGRLRLSIKLSRVLLSIPLVLHTLVDEHKIKQSPLISALKNVIYYMEKVESSMISV